METDRSPVVAMVSLSPAQQQQPTQELEPAPEAGQKGGTAGAAGQETPLDHLRRAGTVCFDILGNVETTHD